MATTPVRNPTTLGSRSYSDGYSEPSWQNAPRAGFHHNRYFVGVNRTINEWLSVDAGYMIQFVDTAEPAFPDRVNHILLLQLYLNT